ncbi:MAG: motility-associated protein [Gemmataceae bacterium]
MVVIGGCIFVIVAVLTGFTMAGGHVHSLIHPSELVTIGGAALGGLIVMSPTKVLKDLAKGLGQLVKGSPFTKAMYMDLFRVLNGLGRIIRRDGLLALESHISSPKDSAVFQAAPKILANHHVTEFICSSLALIVDGRAEAAQLHGLMEEEIKVIEREHHAASGALAKVADALPGFGIVAAVLGIVVTMGEIGGPVEEIGHKVGPHSSAPSLGFSCRTASSHRWRAMDMLGELELVFFRVIAGAVVSVSEGASPNDVISRACRSVGTDCRPTHAELAAIYAEK